MTRILPGALVCLLLAAMPTLAQTPDPKVKKLHVAADPLKGAVLVGRATTGNMVFQLEIEGAEAMWMPMGNPPVWGAHQPTADERYHVEFKLTDPRSKTRIPYVAVVFTATNRDNGRTMTLALPPMWGSSGLHYSANSALLGDGTYAATVTVGVPTFQRVLKDKDLWPQPITAAFHYRLHGGKLVEISQPQ